MAVRYQSAPESDTDKARSTARRVALPLCPSCPRRSLGTCANEIAPMRMDHGSNGSIFFSVVNDILLSQRCRTNDFELVPTGNSFWMTSRKVHEGTPGSTWNKSPEVDQLENEQKIFSKIGKIGDEDQMAKWPNGQIQTSPNWSTVLLVPWVTPNIYWSVTCISVYLTTWSLLENEAVDEWCLEMKLENVLRDGTLSSFM